jgi:hypothetical protein
MGLGKTSPLHPRDEVWYGGRRCGIVLGLGGWADGRYVRGGQMGDLRESGGMEVVDG